jgi:hypothetical protein
VIWSAIAASDGGAFEPPDVSAAKSAVARRRRTPAGMVGPYIRIAVP